MQVTGHVVAGGTSISGYIEGETKVAINIKLSSVETAEFTPLSEGWYDAVIHDIRLRESLTTKRSIAQDEPEPQLAVTFRVTEEDSLNRRLFAYYTLAPDTEEYKGLSFTKRFLRGVGIDVSVDPTVEEVMAHLKGMVKDSTTVEIHVEQQTWNDTLSNRVSEVQKA